jgi:hypothetical protein
MDRNCVRRADVKLAPVDFVHTGEVSPYVQEQFHKEEQAQEKEEQQVLQESVK